MFAMAMALAMAIEAAIGWPAPLYRRIGHPVTWIGRLITALERRWNRGGPRRRKLAGLACLGATLAAVLAPSLALQALLPGGALGVVLGGVLAFALVASRSLHDHVAAVARPLLAGDLAGARGAVAMIVGRDPAQLDGAGVARAAIESLAENSSDGIVAPLFWGAIAGLPGIAAYKAINTLDSMIGHRNERYGDFGWASARLDDLVNLAPARLTGLLFALAAALGAGGQAGGQAGAQAIRCMARDAGKHRSPNAGWPESAMAGALGIRLSGPRVYHGHVAPEPYVNAGHPDPGAADLARALALYRRAMLALWLALVGLGLVLNAQI